MNIAVFDKRADDGGVRFLIIKTTDGRFLADCHARTSAYHTGENSLFGAKAFATYEAALAYLNETLCMADEIAA